MLAVSEEQIQEEVWGHTYFQTNTAEHLLEKISTRRANVAIVGLGYVGLPLAISFAEAGYRITGIDINQQLIDQLNSGHSTVGDVPSDRLAALVPKTTKLSSSENGNTAPEKLVRLSSSSNGANALSDSDDESSGSQWRRPR